MTEPRGALAGSWLASMAVHGVCALAFYFLWQSQSPLLPPVVLQLELTPKQPQPVVQKTLPLPASTPIKPTLTKKVSPPEPVPNPAPPSPPSKTVELAATPALPVTPALTAPVATATVTAPQTPSVAPAKPAPATEPKPVSAAAAPSFVHADYKTAYLQNPKPPYPTMSRRLGESGTVTLWVVVEPSGGVESLGILKTSGFERLDEAAVKAVKLWRFTPAKRGGEAVTDRVSVPIEFSL